VRSRSSIKSGTCEYASNTWQIWISLGWRRVLTSANLLRGTLLQLAIVCLLEAIFPRWLAIAFLVVLVSYVMDGRLALLRGYEYWFIRRYRG